MNKGIKVYDSETSEEMGISKVCAKKAVFNTAASRIILSMPTFCIPGIAMFLLDKMGLIPRATAPRTVLELTVIAFALWTALPVSVSLFPQRGEINGSDLE